jgi:hypothetical protein
MAAQMSPGWQAAAEIALTAGRLGVTLEMIETTARVALTARFEPGGAAVLHDALTRILGHATPALAAYKTAKTGERDAPDPR